MTQLSNILDLYAKIQNRKLSLTSGDAQYDTSNNQLIFLKDVVIGANCIIESIEFTSTDIDFNNLIIVFNNIYFLKSEGSKLEIKSGQLMPKIKVKYTFDCYYDEGSYYAVSTSLYTNITNDILIRMDFDSTGKNWYLNSYIRLIGNTLVIGSSTNQTIIFDTNFDLSTINCIVETMSNGDTTGKNASSAIKEIVFLANIVCNQGVEVKFPNIPVKWYGGITNNGTFSCGSLTI